MVIGEKLVSVAPGVWIWSAFDDSVRTDLYSTAVQADEGLVLLDPIRLESVAIGELASFGPVAAIVLTNGNHTRASGWFRERFSAPVFSHPHAVSELMTPIDGTLRTDRPVAGTLEVIELPGGAPGEVALYHQRGWLHMGDAVVNLASTGLALLPDKYCEDPKRLRLSLESIRGLQVDLVTFAHGDPLVQDAKVRMDALLSAL